MSATLQDFGERKIIRDILPRYSSGIGDDCAILKFPGADLVVTTDPVPEPAAKVIGGDPDPYWMGWLLVIINASDLAAAGADACAFVAAIEAPSTTPVTDFERFLSGISDACMAEGLQYIGGNLREGNKLTAVGTAIGRCAAGTALRRSGSEAGDIIVSIGNGGIFWRDALTSRRGATLPNKDVSPVFRPRSQIRVMGSLAQAGLIAASIDNSDGLLPTLKQLASANSLCVRLDLDSLFVPDLPTELAIDPARLWLGWGDWNVITAVHPDNLNAVSKIGEAVDAVVIPIGELTASEGDVVLRRGNVIRDAPRLESERFAKDSWFASGIEAYTDALLSVELP